MLEFFEIFENLIVSENFSINVFVDVKAEGADLS